MRRALCGLSVAVIAVGTVLGAGIASAEMSPAKQRQSAMKALGGHMKAIGAVAKGKVAHSAATAVHAQAIHEISQYLGLLYPAGSGGEETRAKPEIWSDSSGFSAKIDDFAAVTPFLVAAAKTGNAGAIGAGLRQVGKACGGCHKPYRKPKKK